MSDGSRQRASGCRAVQVDDFQQAAAQFTLRDVTSAMLEKRPYDDHGLSQHDGGNTDQMPAILVPQAELAKTDFTSRRQPALADPKALKLAPVEDRPIKVPGGDRDLCSLFTVEDAQSNLCCCLAHRDRRCNETASTAITDVGLDIDHDRPVGHVGEGRKTLMRHVGYPGAIESDARVYDCRIIRQRRYPFPDLRHRQSEQVDELELACECGNL